METVASTPCDGCGASVPVFAGRSSTCAYCGTHTEAGEQLASAREMVEHAEAIEAAGRQALQFATYRSSVGGASTGVWMAAIRDSARSHQVRKGRYTAGWPLSSMRSPG